MTGEALGAGERLRRLLAILAHLARVGEAPIAELAARFGVDEGTLVAELELAACCGLPPYTPDQLLELVVDGDTVRAYGLDALRRPQRLTPEEGVAVAAAARALLAVPGSADDSPLRTALAKLEVALGEDRMRVDVELSAHALALRQAVSEREVVELDYLGAFRGAETTRVVEPAAVTTREGRLYLDAYCRLAGGWRRFQLERIRAVRPLGEHFVPQDVPEELAASRGAFVGGGAAVVVRVVVPNERTALLERLAAGPIARDKEGSAVVPVAVADRRFLGRLLLRLGPGAYVADPPGLDAARREVAAAALERYRGSPDRGSSPRRGGRTRRTVAGGRRTGRRPS